MREERRRRTRDEDCPAAKKKRDESPNALYSTSNVASTSKSRGHIPVSERQQFALLKLMETKNLSSERATKQTWDGQARDTGEQDKSRPSVPMSSPAMLKQQSGGSTSLPQSATGGPTPSRYSSPHQQQEASYPMERPSNSHLHGHHGHGHSSSSSSSHHSGVSRKAAPVQQQSAPLLTQQRRSTTVTSPESSLMRAAKKGDILTLKMLVKEGSGVNEQDSSGRTPLHECSSQNYIHLVSYLLKHNANPNIRAVPRGGGGGGSGDTPLHEAAREGHARIVRALLRYGADYKICNNNGDRPIDVCTNESCQMVFKQIAQSREYPNTANTTGGSSFPLKKSAEPKSSPSPVSEGHLQSRSSFDEQSDSGFKRRGSPDPDGSSPTQSFRTSNSPHSHQHHHRHHSPNAVRRNTVSVPAPSVDPSINIHQLPRLSSKKDPYAFDDEEVELALQPSQEITTPSTVASTSSSPLYSHRFSGNGRFVSGTGGTLHVNTAASGESGLHSGPSSTMSPSAVVGGGVVGAGGPPLKLRFAMEAGHYTLMENQENILEQGAAISSAAGDIGGSGVSVVQSNPATPKVPEETAALPKPEESGQGTTSADNALKTEIGSEQKAAAATGSEEGGSDDGRLPKVPPLRIKLGGNTPPPSMMQPLQNSEPAVETNSSDFKGDDKKPEGGDEGVNLSGQNPKPETSSTETGFEVNQDAEGASATGGESAKVESGDQEDEEKKVGESTSASTSHPPKRGPGSGTGKAGRAATSESTSGKRHAVSAASESGDNKSKDSNDVKTEDTIKTRSFRTLRSHTAAQREKEEREKSSDAAPPKKRKYRSRGGGGGSAGGGGGGVGNSGAEAGFGGDNDTGKLTDHEDAAGTNEASSMRSGSTNGDGGASTAAGGGDDDAQSAGEGASICGQESKSGRVFDDPNKPSPSGWGENPYEKDAELNRGLSELIGKLVELQPKEPTGYQDYLLVTRDYLLAGHIPQHISRRPCPPELPPLLMELFDEQEDERYAQALKHQSEREQLRLCAEQSVLRAQTRATIALANQPRPLSFCSVMALKGFTYLPPFKDPEHKDEESVRDRFKARTLIGWLQDIKDNFHMEKKKLLCRQLHEAESLMMVQKLDWEVKLKELHLHDYRASIFDQIPAQHVPLIAVPSDFPLFVHDPIQRPS